MLFPHLRAKIEIDVENVVFQELNGDQRRESVNTQQRFAAYREAEARNNGYRGSMGWKKIQGRDYLVRSYYAKSGVRRQTSLGLRSKETEATKLEYDRGRKDAQSRLKDLQAVIARQSAINRAIGLGRVPLAGAKIIRSLDQAGMLGSGIRVLGTNAIYAYEAATGVHIDPGLTATEDIDLLFDARQSLSFIADEDVSQPSLLRLLKTTDAGFRRSSSRKFQAANRDGYLVDLIKPLRDPPWTKEKESVGADKEDLLAAEIEGLSWHESAPSFEAVAIDERGEPCRIVTTDPRVWAAHKLWLSKRKDREPAKKRNDAAQARAIGQLVAKYMPHLSYVADELRMLPRQVFDEAKPLFANR
jgi:hypothetical protein